MNNLEKMGEYKAMAMELTDIGVQYGLDLVTAIAIFIAGFTIARWVARIVRRRLEALKRFDNALIPIVVQIARYGVLVFTVILVLAEFGIETTSIIAVLGAAGLAIGLALQGTLQNVAAGFMLLFIRPFTIGDYIETAAGSGTVEEIGLFLTRLRTPQGIFLAVPNSKIWSDSITNYSRYPDRRLDLTIGISYNDDIDKARKVILDLAKDDKRVQDDPEPIVIVTGLGDSSVDLQLRAWIKRTEFWDANFDLTKNTKYALDKAGITIPYPHVQVIQTPANK
jgi:small conductance mechanosensitive channel